MAAAENSQTVGLSLEHHEIALPTAGTVHVYVQGTRASNEVVILTVHDLGCNYTMYLDFVEHPKMRPVRDKTVWVHVNVPGQEPDAADLPEGFQFPKMQVIAEELINILDHLKVKEVVCFGEGAGANILARFAIAHNQRVMGVCLLHATGTAAGFMESIKDKVQNWKLDQVGMNPKAEAYLVLHRYGTQKGTLQFEEFSNAEDKEQVRSAIENYQSNLRTHTNAKNLKRFVEAFLKRTNYYDGLKKINWMHRCPVLLVTGQKSVFRGTTASLHHHLVKVTEDKGSVEFIEIKDVANVLEEKPEKLVESFQYFLQGLGLVSSVPMHHINKAGLRNRSMSMEEYDMPNKLRTRSISGGSGEQSPIQESPAEGVNSKK